MPAGGARKEAYWNVECDGVNEVLDGDELKAALTCAAREAEKEAKRAAALATQQAAATAANANRPPDADLVGKVFGRMNEAGVEVPGAVEEVKDGKVRIEYWNHFEMIF